MEDWSRQGTQLGTLCTGKEWEWAASWYIYSSQNKPALKLVLLLLPVQGGPVINPGPWAAETSKTLCS